MKRLFVLFLCITLLKAAVVAGADREDILLSASAGIVITEVPQSIRELKEGAVDFVVFAANPAFDEEVSLHRRMGISKLKEVLKRLEKEIPVVLMMPLLCTENYSLEVKDLYQAVFSLGKAHNVLGYYISHDTDYFELDEVFEGDLFFVHIKNDNHGDVPGFSNQVAQLLKQKTKYHPEAVLLSHNQRFWSECNKLKLRKGEHFCLNDSENKGKINEFSDRVDKLSDNTRSLSFIYIKIKGDIFDDEKMDELAEVAVVKKIPTIISCINTPHYHYQ